MPLVYRHNAQETPRPPRAPSEDPEPYHPSDAIDYRPRTLRPPILLTIQSQADESPVIPRPDSGAAESQKENPMAAKKKVATDRPGVIATIVENISKAKGATADETLEVLTKAFPDRDPDGMRKTVLIQSAKQCTSKEKDDKRGIVYFKRR
jgi:hypothetical protein